MKIRSMVSYVAVFLWLSITVFFYFHHQVTVKVLTIENWQLSEEENMGVWIKEIRLINKEMNTSKLYLGDANNNFISILLNMKRFYSLMCKKYDSRNWRFEISGIYLKREPDTKPPQFSVYAKGNTLDESDYKVLNTYSYKPLKNSNLVLFTASAKGINPKADAYVLQWMWDDQKVVTKNYTDGFIYKKYDYFRKLPRQFEFFQPEDKVKMTIEPLLKGDWENAGLTLTQELIRRLEWLNSNQVVVKEMDVNYIGPYQDKEEVFTVTVSFEMAASHEGKWKMQTFYLVAEDGEWSIIDIDSPYND